MKSRTIPCLLAALALFAGSAASQSQPTASFDRLKALVGEWEGKAEKGTPVRVSYKLVSGASVLLETLAPDNEPEMVTMYHPDGSRLLLTHYCSAGNQPRMRAVPSASGSPELQFVFLDATNLASPETGHMHKLGIRFEDKDHFTQRWTWRDNGQEKTEVFHFTRKK